MKKIIVIGKNFGDEGKGLVTSSLSLSFANPLIIKTNGGAQAGHTVENSLKNTRFVHQQTGSGSEYKASTLWTETYHPDLYALSKEIEEFEKTFAFIPKIYAEPAAAITTIDDVIINMAIESKRGNNRHGSCGMGINECSLRNKAGFSISVRDIFSLTSDEILKKLVFIRKEYSLKRAAYLGLSSDDSYMELLNDENVLYNFSNVIKENIRYVEITSVDMTFLNNFGALIFENGQGLLLDEDNEDYAPNVSASKTGLANPMHFLERSGLQPDEVIYVSRPYVTRHGAGNLPCECDRTKLDSVKIDATNVHNEWQGNIRYAKHESRKGFLSPILEDMKNSGCSIKPSLALTHMDETNGKIYFENETLDLNNFADSFADIFENIYFSENYESINLKK